MRLNLQFPVFQMGRAREVVSVSCLLGEAGDCDGVAALPERSRSPRGGWVRGSMTKGFLSQHVAGTQQPHLGGHKGGKMPCVRTGHLNPNGLSSSACPLCSPSRLLSASVPTY